MRSPRLFCSTADKQKLFASRRGFQKKLGAVIDNPVRAGLLEFGVARGSAQRQHACSCRFAGANARRSILDYKAVGRAYPEDLRAFQVRLSVRLAILHIVRWAQIPRLRQSRRADTSV